MNISIFGRAIRLAAIGAILFGSASCVTIDQTLGENFIPTNQIWDVYPCEAVALNDITMQYSDKLSGYSNARFTFGATRDENFVSSSTTSFTLVPVMDSLDFGKEANGYPKIKKFHLSAVRDTLSMVYDRQERILQNVYVYGLKEPLDSTVLYTGTDLKALANNEIITCGIPVYDGGDSLSFDFSIEYTKSLIKGIQDFQSLEAEKRDSISHYLKYVPGIMIGTDPQTELGGRVNMFGLAIEAESGYITGNYALLEFTGLYEDSKEPVDTSFIFYFGPADFLKDDDTEYPTQYAFNANETIPVNDGFMESWEAGSKESIYAAGGSGLKPVIKASEIKSLVTELIDTKISAGNVINKEEVVINKASIILPYNVNGEWDKLDKYPMILSPTVRLVSDDGKYYTYAGLTDSSIESENQGNINRSLSLYSPDISHHVQQILNLTQGVGEDVPENETDEAFAKRLEKYDIWMLILHEEITESSSSTGYYDDYYNNLMYNSYYNNMMYDPYGYGYGYGGYGYGGYGGYGYDSYGYSNYYNYMMMAAYASASSSSSSTSSSVELDKDRFYNCTLNGPGASGEKPSLKITFSAPKQ